jgi:hypothetical protein
MEENNNLTESNGISYCKFCKDKLIFGFDDDKMIHCQYCHNIWDGFAQCQCNLYEEEDDKKNDKENDEYEEKEGEKNNEPQNKKIKLD